ncbi:hypothetical protein K435DRAFT_892881 [Dendrothele bispora CBS 962.96]|uniref:F-box domain-containing protein n=1 Tax=Dendrothele bispora (strain CBS 962.96) TaxID=1314807 RepID=A0A4S8M300_DENBC|nr:hypothetical protein K435DRAFT_892881 [Dendrothele bispora CBS 962.96]
MVSNARAPTISRKKMRRARNDADSDTSEYHSDERIAARPRKRQRREASGPPKRKIRSVKPDLKAATPAEYRRTRGKRGLLEKFMNDFPLELKFEVFRHLEPLDVLRLARTSKSLRAILMSRSSSDIWRAARSNVEGLPPLPHDLNEPQYANLAFDPHCHNCMTRCETIIWGCRMRCCKKCLPKVFCDYDELRARFLWSSHFQDMLWWACPQLDFDLEGIKSPWGSGPAWIGVIPSATEKIALQLEKLSPEEYKDWIDAQKVLSEVITEFQHVEACIKWRRSKTEERSKQLATIRSRRKETIIQRLNDLGWGETVKELLESHDDPFSSHRLVNQAKDLTDRVSMWTGWRNIEGPLVEFLAERRANFQAEKRLDTLRYRCTILRHMYKARSDCTDPNFPMPSIGHAMMSWRVFDNIWKIPFDQESIEAEVQECFQKLTPLISEWHSHVKRSLLEIVQRELPHTRLPDLALAKTVFECNSCGEYLWYADAFVHKCLITIGPQDQAREEARRLEFLDLGLPYDPYEEFDLGIWRVDVLRYSHEASRKAIMTMEVCGLDIETTTVDDLHILNPIMECLTCADDDDDAGRTRTFLRWEHVILHNDQCEDIVRLSDEDFQNLREQIENWERNEMNSAMFYTSDPLRCKLCHYPGNLKDIKSHLKRRHKVGKMTKEHWRWNPGRVHLEKRVGIPLWDRIGT